MSSRRLPLPSILAAAAAVVLAAAALPAAAYPGCSDSTPAVSAPQSLWGGLQPAADEPFADTTHYNGHQLPNHQNPLWSALDVEDGTLFASYTGGFAIYTLGDPDNPKKAGMADLRSAAFPRPVTWFSELRDFIYYVDAPRGRSDVAVVAGLQQAGLTVFDTTSKNNPIARYQDSGGQDTGKNFTGLYTAAVGNRLFAFAGVGTNGPGLYAYDVSKALQSNGCSENTFRSTSCGVVQPAIDPSPVAYVAGVDVGGGRHLIATSGTSAAPGVKVWEIVPSAAFGYQASLRVNTSGSAHGVAVWTQGSKTYLAVRTTTAGQIYDISSCMGGSCSSLSGKEVGPGLQLGFISGWQSVTFSRAGNRDSGTPFLYFGNDGKCHGMTAATDTIPGDDGRKKEWLFDVSNPASPVEITGNKTLPVDGGKKPAVDYWSFSYARNPSGFSQVMPRMGQFSGDHFYRAAWTIMEAHQRVNLDPTIGLFGPIEGYPKTPQTFTASANNCTPTAGWQWSALPDGEVIGSGSSVSIEFASQGAKTVIATNAGCGNASAEQVVTILDPAPVIGDVTVSPASPTVCQPITLKAIGVTGQPTLTYSWTVAPTVAGLQQNGDSATWTPPADTLVGTYEASVTVSGPGGSAIGTADVQVAGLDPLPGAGFAIDNEPFTGSKVKFEGAVPGATTWRWTFGDGNVLETSDPVLGPRPEHTFSCTEALCTFDVTVEVKNCVETTYVKSATLQVVIDNPLEVRGFSPVCAFNICGFSTGESIVFTVDASGDPDQYQVDWAGNGSFVAATPSTCPAGLGPVCLTHAYSAEGTFTPKVKVVRDSQASDPLTSARSVTIVKPTNTPPPTPPTKTISVTGPSTGTVGQALTFSASASGCTAASNGWSWNTGGGSGSSTSSSITITFATTGSRTVSATNSGCSGVSGSRTVSIGVNQSALAANFTFTPALPKVGDTVKLDASASAGSPQFYFWKIDGETIQGKTLDYVFTTAGSHSVTLEVSKQDTSCQLGMCTATTTKTVVVQGTPEPPPPPPVLGNGCAGADAENPALLCLLDGRFRVHVDWINHHAGGETGSGHSVRSSATGDTTGFFWFFNADNIELLVKMLDGTSVNGHYWVFHGGLSDIQYVITVEDTVAGTSRTYTKLAGTIGGGSDTAAFPASAGASTAASQRVTGATHQGGGGGESDDGSDDEGGGDTVSADSLLLLDGRFEVTVDFLNQHAGDQPGAGRAVAGTNNAGYFWFFTQDNLELVVKMIDARPFDGHFWVFWTGLSDIKYNIEVKDRQTGESWEFHNPAGKVGGGADTSAFGG